MGAEDRTYLERLRPCEWRILSISLSGGCDEYLVPNQQDQFNLVQLLPNGLLIATNRCESDSRPNAKLFDFNGEFQRSLLLGDGIAELQATATGRIWASYCDEGVFGHSLARPGLRQFDDMGRTNFAFKPVSGLEGIVDCYALNVSANDEAWCYYYTQFPIVRIKSGRIVEFWQSPIEGSSAICVWRDSVLIQGGYKANDWKLLSLCDHGLARVYSSYEFLNGDGQILTSRVARARGQIIWFVEGSEVYWVSLKDLIS
jgi:hypothetical protein